MGDIVSDLQSFNEEKLNSEPYTCERIANAAAEEITRLREENARLREDLAGTIKRMSKLDFERTAAEFERDALREENARLRKALKPFAYIAEQVGDEDARWAVPSAYLRAAAAAIREGGKS